MSTLVADTRPLTAQDRCDRCGGQAYVRFSRGASEVLMCAHHNREHGAKAAQWADRIRDETAKLTS